MEMKLEQLADVDRAKTFYAERLGFVEDVDVQRRVCGSCS